MSAAPALSVTGLGAHAGKHTLLSGIDVTLPAGRVLAVLGASGAGKSTFGLAVLGESGPGVTLSGRVAIAGQDLLPARVAHPSAGRVAHVPQHPGSALDPVRRVGPVLDELAGTVHGRGRRARAARRDAVARALEAARLDPDHARRFPHQLSGGQQQRVALALALVVAPSVVVLDEPTTGLDPVTTAEVVTTLAGVAAAGTALVVLTHDHAVARALAHDVLVLHDGAVAARELPAEASDGTSLAPDARIGTSSDPEPDAEPDHGPAPRLDVRGLAVTVGRGVTLLDGVGLTAATGECLAVVGRSGAGKTSFGRALAGLRTPSGGRVAVDGRELHPSLGSRDREQRRLVQYVHQDPRASFLDHRAVRDQVARPAELLRGLGPDDSRAEADALLERLGLDRAMRGRRPGALSGGQLQRAALARALVARPAVLVADEVTSALDARRRADLLDALDALRREEGTTLVLVSHDLPLVSRVADRVAVLDAGRLVEHATVADLWSRPASAAGRRLVDTARDPATVT